MTFLKNKWTITVFILIIGLSIFIGVYSLQDEDIVPVDLVVVGKQPVLLYDGVVYRHGENEGWEKLDYEKKIKAGIDPDFKAEDINLPHQVDCWK